MSAIKVLMAVTVDPEVVDELDDRVKALNRDENLVSRSSLANFALRKYLNLAVSERMEDLMDEKA